MGKFYSFTILLLLSCLSGQAQWSRGYGVHSRHGNAVQVLNFSNNVVVGGNLFNDSIFVIEPSIAMGTGWDYIGNGGTHWLRGISFPTPQTGYTVGFNGETHKTVDAGFNWDTLFAPLTIRGRDFQAVHFVNNDTGYIVGGHQYGDSIQTILKTIDGGQNWMVQRDSFGYWLKAICFINPDTAFAVGEHGAMLKTTDAGNHWNDVTLTSIIATRTFNGIYFLNSDTGFIVGGDQVNGPTQTLLHTTDGGNNWNVMIDSAGPCLNGINFADATNGYIVGDQGLIWESTDGGGNWIPEIIDPSINTTDNINAVHFFNKHLGMAVGDWGKMLMYYDSAYYRNSFDSTLFLSSSGYTGTVIFNGKVDPQGHKTAVWFEYGTTVSLGSRIIATPDTINGNGWQNVSASMSGLSSGTLYYYRVASSNATYVGYGETNQYATNILSPPSDSTLNAVIISPNTAQLNGMVNGNGFTTAVTFEYGTTTALGTTVSAVPDTLFFSGGWSNVSAVIPGLTPGAQYYFRVDGVNSMGATHGNTLSFYNSAPFPLDTTKAATLITTAAAQLNGAVNANGSDATVSFEYGTSAALGTVVPATPNIVTNSNIQNVSASISGLVANTQYFYRVKAVNAGGANYGDILVFSTNQIGPSAVTNPATNITLNGVQLNGNVNANGDVTTVTFEYGTSTALGNSINATPNSVSGNSWQNVSATLTGLNANMEYYYRLKAVNSTNTVYGSTKQFYSGNPEIPNWDFELWDNITEEVPRGWNALGGVRKIAYNGGYAAELFGALPGDFGIMVLNGIIGDGIRGGIPFAARPDSLIGYYNYNVVAGDTAMMGLLFRKADTVMFTKAIPFVGSSGGNFVRIASPITYPNADVPDSILIVAVSTNILSSGQPGNINSKLAVTDLSFTGTTLPIPNENFTDWDSLRAIFPKSWQTSVIFLGINSVQKQTTDRYYGNYAIKLTNDPALTKQDAMSNSFHVSNRHISLNGYYKWLPNNNDTLSMGIDMYKAGQPIGSGLLLVTNPAITYQPFSIDIAYHDSTTVPDSASINFGLGYRGPVRGGSVGYFDHFSFDGFLEDGINDTPAFVAATDGLKVYPNPTTGEMNVEYLNQEPDTTSYRIYDLRGKAILNETENILTTGITTKQLNISGCAQGIYILNVVTGKNNLTRKIIIQ